MSFAFQHEEKEENVTKEHVPLPSKAPPDSRPCTGRLFCWFDISHPTATPLNSPTRIRARAPSPRDGKVTRPPVGTRKGGGEAARRGEGTGEGSQRQTSSKTSRKKFTGVKLDKRRSRWEARCKIGGKTTSLGIFASEEEAARAWDRMKLWSCKAGEKKKENLTLNFLNFPLTEYSDDEVTTLQGLTREEVIQKLRQTGQEERVASQSSKYTGVRLVKKTGLWEAHYRIGGRPTSLGIFGSEEEAARAWDRMQLWACKAHVKKKEEVEFNFPLSDYSEDEVAAPQGFTQKEMLQKLRRTEERVANQTSKCKGVISVKKTGRWRAECRIGGKKTSLGAFGSEEEAARAWDRMQLWACKAHVKKKEEVYLNFPLFDYSDAEVTALQGCTQEEIIQKLRRTAEQSRTEYKAKAVERPASPGPVAPAQGTQGESESLMPPGLEFLVVMSGNPLACGICFEEFDDADATGASARHMFWPCQHARQCGDCDMRVWKTPAKLRQCPWCKSKIDSRPRPLKPYV
jgi:hypothetical protein